MLLQETLLQRADGVDEKMIAQSRKLREQVFAILKEEHNSDVAGQKVGDILEEYLGKLSPSDKRIAEAYYGPKEAQVGVFNSAWFRYWLTYDPLSVLKQIKIPILALNGELDLVVSAEQNLKRIDLALKEINHKDYIVKQFPNLNHAFQTCAIGTMSECAHIEETASPLALNTISEWILERTSKKK